MKTILFNGQEQKITEEGYSDLLVLANKELSQEELTNLKVSWALNYINVELSTDENVLSIYIPNKINNLKDYISQEDLSNIFELKSCMIQTLELLENVYNDKTR